MRRAGMRVNRGGVGNGGASLEDPDVCDHVRTRQTDRQTSLLFVTLILASSIPSLNQLVALLPPLFPSFLQLPAPCLTSHAPFTCSSMRLFMVTTSNRSLSMLASAHSMLVGHAAEVRNRPVRPRTCLCQVNFDWIETSVKRGLAEM